MKFKKFMPVLAPVSYTHLDVYKRQVLDRLYNDYKQFFTEHVTVSEDAKLDYAQQIIDILDRNTANVHDDELRFYMNEMVIFSLNEAMKDGNNRVKPVDEKMGPTVDELPIVDLRKAINAPTIQ